MSLFVKISDLYSVFALAQSMEWLAEPECLAHALLLLPNLTAALWWFGIIMVVYDPNQSNGGLGSETMLSLTQMCS